VAIVDGFDPKGPLIVFEAKTSQLTWAQWNSLVLEVWGVTVSISSPTPPTTTTTLPPTTTVPPTTTTTIPPTTTSTIASTGPPASDYGPQNETYLTYGN